MVPEEAPRADDDRGRSHRGGVREVPRAHLQGRRDQDPRDEEGHDLQPAAGDSGPPGSPGSRNITPSSPRPPASPRCRCSSTRSRPTRPISTATSSISTGWHAEFFPQIAEEGRLFKRPKTLRDLVGGLEHRRGTLLDRPAVPAAPPPLRRLERHAPRDRPLRRRARGRPAGRYDERAVRLVGQAERARYFDHDPKAQRWTVKDELKSLATWKSHNLLRAINEEPFDCVFIKNVLIYFDAPVEAGGDPAPDRLDGQGGPPRRRPHRGDL